MLRISRLVPALFLFLYSAGGYRAQDFLGLQNNNYSGVITAISNPANIADSRYNFDMVLGGINTTLENNYFGVKRSALAFSGSIFNPRTVRFPKLENTDRNSDEYYKNNIVIVQSDHNKAIYSSSRLVLPYSRA